MSAVIPSNTSAGMAPASKGVGLRAFPYPYKAALTICNDPDDTKTTQEFVDVQRFLNSKKLTPLGEGLGLEIGNSFYFYDDERHFSFYTHEERAQRVIIDLIRAGYIDCLHTYGDAATSRAQILRGLDVLRTLDCTLQVWVNHNGSRNNLGRKFEYLFDRAPCQGDTPGSPVFHADVTLDYGIRFAWVGATTRVIGQSPKHPSSLFSTVADFDHLPSSTLSVAKEWRKKMLGSRGDKRYTLHNRNDLMQVMELETGQKLHEFIRYCHHPKGVRFGSTAQGLAQVISPRMLEQLKAVQGYAIVYTHFGQRNGSAELLPPGSQAALRQLEQEYREGHVYVTTTAKLLNYHHAFRNARWSYETVNGWTSVRIDHLEDPIFGKSPVNWQQLQGITFYVPDKNKAEVYVQGCCVPGLQRNCSDESGEQSVTIPFVPLEFPL